MMTIETMAVPNKTCRALNVHQKTAVCPYCGKENLIYTIAYGAILYEDTCEHFTFITHDYFSFKLTLDNN